MKHVVLYSTWTQYEAYVGYYGNRMGTTGIKAALQYNDCKHDVYDVHHMRAHIHTTCFRHFGND